MHMNLFKPGQINLLALFFKMLSKSGRSVTSVISTPGGFPITTFFHHSNAYGPIGFTLLSW